MSVERRTTSAGAVRYVARVKSGRQLVATKTFGRKADAEAWEREQRRALAFGEFIPPSRSSAPFSQVAAQFIESRRDQVSPHSWRTDRDNLAGIPTWFTARPLSSIGESEVLAYLTGQLAIRARSTVQRSRTTLSSVFAYAVREKMISRNPVREVRMPPGARQTSVGVETFTDDELARTLRLQYEIRPHVAAVTEFLSLTGLRWSELRALRVRDFQHGPLPAVRVSRAQSDGYAEKGTKTGKTRVVPLTARASEIALTRVIGRAKTEFLFTGESGRQLSGNLFRRFVKWSETAPRGRTVHDLRHHAASSWLRAGIPVNQVSQWLGHANPNTTLKVYAHVLGEAQDITAIARLNGMSAEHAKDISSPYMASPDAGAPAGPSI
ncbi:MAG: tyrosine-type recombinase/integrase [Salinibacterium sp.]|nr:tyrosine-type recombinase/integrase [Salinibacterium sp.]